jgi:hypothetical protein
VSLAGIVIPACPWPGSSSRRVFGRDRHPGVYLAGIAPLLIVDILLTFACYSHF